MKGVPKKRQRLSKKTKKPFKWNLIPEELQQIIVDKMDRETNCKFMRCSKKSENQARRSPDYLYGYEIKDADGIKIVMLSFTEMGTDYWYEFLEVQGEPNRTVVMYKSFYNAKNPMGDTKWVELVDGSPEENRIKYIRKHVQNYKYSIQFFRVNDSKLPLEKFDIRELKHLETLVFNDNFPEITPEKMNNFIDIKQIQNIQHLRDIPMTFTFEQILNLNGQTLVIKSAEFDLQNILEYLKMLETEEIFIEEFSVFRTIRDDFEMRDLSKNLNVSKYSEESDEKTSSCSFNFNSVNHRKYAVYFSKDCLKVYSRDC